MSDKFWQTFSTEYRTHYIFAAFFKSSFRSENMYFRRKRVNFLKLILFVYLFAQLRGTTPAPNLPVGRAPHDPSGPLAQPPRTTTEQL